MRRVMEALGVDAYVDVARRLSTDAAPMAERTVQNWSARGVPAWRLEQIAQRTGCRVAWLRDGEEPMHADRALVAAEPAAARYGAGDASALTPRERALLNNFRALDEPAKSALEQTGAVFAQQAKPRRRRDAA